MNSKLKNKKILIIGSSLYGCILAYKLAKKKNDIILIDSSKTILNSLNSISIDSISLNNGFHGLDYPRAKDLYEFFEKRIRANFTLKKKVFKILINNKILDYELGINQWPVKLTRDLKKNFTITKKKKLRDFYKKNFYDLVKKCGRRFNDTVEEYKHLIIPWFLPRDYKLKSNDEGDVFRQKVREKKVDFFYAYPKQGLFEVLQQKFKTVLFKKGIKIFLNTNVTFNKNKTIIIKKNKKILFNNYKFDKVFFCAPSALILKFIDLKHFKKLAKYRRFLQNVLIEINSQYNFTEMICLNKNIYKLNRISLVSLNKKKNKSLIQLEIINDKEFLSSNLKKQIKNEIKKIFKSKQKPIILGYKTSRVMFFPSNKWKKKAKEILNRWIKKFDGRFNMRYSFGPFNMAKAWYYAKEDSKLK